METNLRALRAKIKGFSAESSTINNRISRAHDQKKAQLWREKRNLGAIARDHLVAYALLRGKSYRSVERKCRPGSAPNCSAVLKLIHEHGPFAARREWTDARVSECLSQAAS